MTAWCSTSAVTAATFPNLRGDQDDDVSQVLVTHDVKRIHDKGGASLGGVLPDFKISDLLAAIPSRNVLFIVDSCHSGTVTRSFNMDNHSPRQCAGGVC